MALQGNLEDFELTDVFQLVQLGQKDGALKIQADDNVGVVYFKKGMVVHAKTNYLRGEAAIDSLLSWKKGRFIFVTNEETIETTVDLPIQQVILDAARRIDELKRIQKLIPSFHTVVKIVEVPISGAEKINLKPEEWKVLSFVDGARSVKEIASKAHLSEFESSRILYGLISSGLVEVATRIEAPKFEPLREKKKAQEQRKDKGGGFLGMFKKK